MKKNLAGLFVAAAMVVSLCACGSGGSGSTTAEKTSEAAAGAATEAAAGAAAGEGDAVTLTYVTWNENQRGQIQDTIDGFQKLYPNIKVDLQITPMGGVLDETGGRGNQRKYGRYCDHAYQRSRKVCKRRQAGAAR